MVHDYIESIHSSERLDKEKMWSTNGLCGSKRNQRILPDVSDSNTPNEGYRKKLPILPQKRNFTCENLYVYIHGFLIDLGQFHYYSSTNPLRTKGPNECNPPVSGFLIPLLSYHPFPSTLRAPLTPGLIKPTIPDPPTADTN